MRHPILLVDDDDRVRASLRRTLESDGWAVDEARDGVEGLNKLTSTPFSCAVLDLKMPRMDGEQLFRTLRSSGLETQVIILSGHGDIALAVEYIKAGAFDFIEKPPSAEKIRSAVRQAAARYAAGWKLRDHSRYEAFRYTLVGSGPALGELREILAKAAQTRLPVLITGESGTGKELAAREVHRLSERREGPFVQVNCAAIPEDLIESELFGHEKGAFTGAEARKMGRFEMANNGTILLDEIGELPLHLQAKLLRVLQEREIERVGGGAPIRIDVRVLCATARKLLTEVREGRFREDLYYRLQVIPVAVPPLRERKEDIPELCTFFLREFGSSRGRDQNLSPAALQLLMAYNYPGNVRELRNIIERITVLNPASVVEPWLLPAELTREERESEASGALPLRLGDAVAAAEKACILRALQATGGKKSETAHLLGISRKNLWEKMRVHRIEE